MFSHGHEDRKVPAISPVNARIERGLVRGIGLGYLVQSKLTLVSIYKQEFSGDTVSEREAQ
jgi:hypothetical protein